MDKINAMTQGFNELCASNTDVAKWAIQALSRIQPEAMPDMVVGRPGIPAELLEDGGRTLILPVPTGLPTLYACVNETGGATLMLADEY